MSGLEMKQVWMESLGHGVAGLAVMNSMGSGGVVAAAAEPVSIEPGERPSLLRS